MEKLAAAMKLQSESSGYCVEPFLWAMIVDVTRKSFNIPPVHWMNLQGLCWEGIESFGEAVNIEQ